MGCSWAEKGSLPMSHLPKMAEANVEISGRERVTVTESMKPKLTRE